MKVCPILVGTPRAGALPQLRFDENPPFEAHAEGSAAWKTGREYAGIEKPRELDRRARGTEGEAMRSDPDQRETAKSNTACGCLFQFIGTDGC